MARQNVHFLAFNRGLISPRALARVDLRRTGLSAETQTNWMPRVLGSMMLRPGLGYIGSTKSDAFARHIPFVFASDDTAAIELTANVLRVRISDTILTRPSVSSAVTNGAFTSDVSGWTDADESGATSEYAASLNTYSGSFTGLLKMTGTGYNAAIRHQQVTVAGGDQNVEHALRISVAVGPVTLRVGTSAGDDSYVAETELGTGTHSLAFTPTGNFFIYFSSRRSRPVYIDSVTVESSGSVEITTAWGSTDLALLRWVQSGDVVYVAAEGKQPRKIERRGTGRSWSLVLYEPENGPFRVQNTGPIQISSSALSGDVTLTASAPLFSSSHVGALFRIDSIGQVVTVSASGANQFSDPIRITGTGTSRAFTYTITGTWSATVRIQYSIGEAGSWIDASGLSFTVNTSGSHNDGLDNQIVYYRIGIKTGEYTSGTAVCTLNYASGSITGIAKITGTSSSTAVSAYVLKNLGNTSASDAWYEGAWSTLRGWPSAVTLFDGRLWFAGLDNMWGSVSDEYENFDLDTEGDSGPISRSIGEGPVEAINWLLPLQRLTVGTASAEKSVRSSSLDEPLTPTNFGLKDASTQGSAAITPLKVDKHGLFVQIGETRLFQLQWDFELIDYVSKDLTKLIPELGAAGIAGIAVQRKPDTRIHMWLDDGTVGVLVYDPVEDIECWVKVETDGDVEDVFTLPGTAEDLVYYVVNRTINGATKRYLEKWALESECEGGTLNKQADSFVTFTNSPASATVTGLSHLEGESVVVWADGKCLRDSNGGIATFVVASGQITLTNAGSAYSATTGVVGLTYTASYKSTKLAYAAEGGTPLIQPKAVFKIGFVAQNLHHKGIKYGPDADNLDDLPLQEEETDVATDTVHAAYDEHSFEFNGVYDTDARIYLQANAPRPATINAAVISMVVNDKL